MRPTAETTVRSERSGVDKLDLHGERAALRGNPSFVWRAGQDRRLAMIVRWGLRHPRTVVERILVDGCGVGMYVRALQPYAFETWGMDIEPEHLALAEENAPDARLQLAMCESSAVRQRFVRPGAEPRGD